ncbi:MAG: hypothetical protein ACR2HN_10520 [Tepidiformaceae bacterium]
MERQHTPPPCGAATTRPFTERKIKPGGELREYACTLLILQPGLAVAAFLMEAAGAVFGPPLQVPPGSISYGYFWKRRPYVIYRMKSPMGALLAHRFDAVTAVQLTPDSVTYRDLALDWWVLPGGEIIEEDREEFESLCAEGVLTAADSEAARTASSQVYSRYRHIIDDLEVLERRLKIG